MATSEHHHRLEKNGWRVFTARHAPPSTLAGHLTFVLKPEGLDLAALKRLFHSAGPAAIESRVKATPTRTYASRIWFLCEWLLGERLALPDAEKGAYPQVVDLEQKWAATGETSPRHRGWSNLPDTPAFCPLVFRTKAPEEFGASSLFGVGKAG